jgi:hypothetical protein
MSYCMTRKRKSPIENSRRIIDEIMTDYKREKLKEIT